MTVLRFLALWIALTVASLVGLGVGLFAAYLLAHHFGAWPAAGTLFALFTAYMAYTSGLWRRRGN